MPTLDDARACSHEQHAAARRSIADFRRLTTNHKTWDLDGEVVLLGDCRCGSTLMFELSPGTEG